MENTIRKRPSGSKTGGPKRIPTSPKEPFQMAATVDSAIYDWDLESQRVSWTEGISKLFGYSMSEVDCTDQWWIDHVHPDDRSRVLREIDVEIEKARDFCVEYRFRSKDNQYRMVQDRGLIVRNRKGRPIRVVGSVSDITERKAAEETLKLLIEVVLTASESSDIHVLTSNCLEKMCVLRRWQLGQAWFVDENEDKLFCSHSFYSEIDVTDLRKLSLQFRIPKGLAVPGKVWQTGQPIWISDFESDPDPVRFEALKKTALQSGFAFPIFHKGELLAIFEFFSVEKRSHDEHLFRVAPKLGAHLGVVFERKQEQEAIRHQAYHDVLTGLPNRSLFDDRFTLAVAHSRRRNQMLALLFLDLDRFKNVNDTLGHAVGDQLLREAAQRLARSVREVDTIARMGGDEFTLLLPEIEHIEDAAKVAQKILSLFSTPFSLEKHKVVTTTSIGISIFPHDGEDVQTLLRNADLALYRAKEKGRNNYQLYTPAMTAVALARLKIESDLREAVQGQQFLLNYQPIIDLRSGRVLAVEGLLRWQHPDLGLLLPAEFIPIAEETGLMLPLWEWTLRTGCSQAKRWQEMGLRQLRLAMNIPNFVFHQPNLVQIVAEILRETEFTATSLSLEITENLAIKRDIAASLISGLQEMGVRICLDDFGTGYSSLSHLKNFSVNAIKIDPDFIRDLGGGTENVALTRAIVTLGQSLNVTVVAEHVETRAQLDSLRSIGCDAAQGFLFCRPMPAEALTPLLEKNNFL